MSKILLLLAVVLLGTIGFTVWLTWLTRRWHRNHGGPGFYLLPVMLALLPCAAAAQSLSDAVTGGYSPVASRYQWGSTGGDWAVPANATAPVVDCKGDFRTGSCGSTTFTASGSPGLASTYWRPGGGAVAGSGVAFDGSTYFSAGDLAAVDAPSKLLVVARFKIPAETYKNVILKGAAPGSATNGWGLYVAGQNPVFIATKAGGAYSIISGGTHGTGTECVVVAFYKYVADGTSVLRANFCGTAQSAVTNAVGPIQDVSGALAIGSNGGTGGSWTSSMSTVRVWTQAQLGDWEPTDADLARMVRSQYASQGSLGEPLTVTRASAKSCSIGGAWFTVPSNQPCIGSDGLSVEGQRTQYALANCSAPADQTVTLSAGAHTLWMEGSGSVAAAVGTATATGLPCTATSASACSFTVSVGGTVTLDATGAVTAMQVENGARSSLICAASTPVTRQADVLSVPIPAGALWAVYTLDGVRTVLDVSANTSPLTVGVGQELAVTGAISGLHFCYSPNSEDCQ